MGELYRHSPVPLLCMIVEASVRGRKGWAKESQEVGRLWSGGRVRWLVVISPFFGRIRPAARESRGRCDGSNRSRFGSERVVGALT